MNYLSAIFHSDLERQSRKLSKASVYPQRMHFLLYMELWPMWSTCYFLQFGYCFFALLWLYSSEWKVGGRIGGKIIIIKSDQSNKPWYVLGYHLDLARDFISTHKVNYEATKTVGKRCFSSPKSQIYQVSIFFLSWLENSKGFSYIWKAYCYVQVERERLKLS